MVKLIVYLLLPILTISSCKSDLKTDVKVLASGVSLNMDKSNNMKLVNSDVGLDLSIELFNTYYFLEHVYSWDQQVSSNFVVCFKFGTGDIMYSNNLGETFQQVVKGESQLWTGCLTTKTGRHMLWDSKSNLIWIYSKDWVLVKKVKTGDYYWHGNWSIAEMNGTIIYAEYADQAENLNVWRSVDDGETWSIVFSQKGRLSKNGEIRHFHTVQPDPFNLQNWYLSSGDDLKENKIWLSRNDGLDWIEVTDPSPIGTNLQNVHRFTSLTFTDNYLYWGTDDIMNGNAKLVRARRSIPLKVEVIGELGNVTRSLITYNSGAFFLSEQKIQKNGLFLDATINYTPDFQNVSLYKSFPNLDNIDTGFTFSRSSIAAKDGVFFTYFGGHVLYIGKYGCLKWTITLDSQSAGLKEKY